MLQTKRISFFAIPAILLVILGISLFSGYHSVPDELPRETLWRFSPIGLFHDWIMGIRTDIWEWESQSLFTGKFARTFDYARVFFKTCMLEFPFYWFCFRRFRFKNMLALLFALNALTHPIVFFVLPALVPNYMKCLLIAETYAAGAEALLAGWIVYRYFSLSQGILGAFTILIANLFSWQVGLIW